MKNLKDDDPPTDGELALILERWPIPNPHREYTYPERDQVTTLHRLVAEVRRLRDVDHSGQRRPALTDKRLDELLAEDQPIHDQRPITDEEFRRYERGAYDDFRSLPTWHNSISTLLAGAHRLVLEVRRLRCELHDAKMEAAFWAPHAADCAHCHGRCGREHPEAPPR